MVSLVTLFISLPYKQHNYYAWVFHSASDTTVLCWWVVQWKKKHSRQPAWFLPLSEKRQKPMPNSCYCWRSGLICRRKISWAVIWVSTSFYSDSSGEGWEGIKVWRNRGMAGIDEMEKEKSIPDWERDQSAMFASSQLGFMLHARTLHTHTHTHGTKSHGKLRTKTAPLTEAGLDSENRADSKQTGPNMFRFGFIFRSFFVCGLRCIFVPSIKSATLQSAFWVTVCYDLLRIQTTFCRTSGSNGYAIVRLFGPVRDEKKTYSLETLL